MYIVMVILSLLFLPFLEYFLFYIGFGSLVFALVIYFYNNEFIDSVVFFIIIILSMILDVAFQINLGSYLFIISIGLVIFWGGEQLIHLNLWWQEVLLYVVSLYFMNLLFNYFVYLGEWGLVDLTEMGLFPWKISIFSSFFNFLLLGLIYLGHKLIMGDLGKDSKLTV